MVALVGRDVPSGRSVEAEAMGLLPSQPRARQRIGTSSEALRAGPRARQRIGYSSEALRARPRARRRIGSLSEAFRARPRARWRVDGLGEGRGLANSCLLALILTGSKRFFQFLLMGPLFMIPHSHQDPTIQVQTFLLVSANSPTIPIKVYTPSPPSCAIHIKKL